MTATALLVLHHSLYTALLVTLTRATSAVGRSVWQGVRPEVVRLSEDVAAVLFKRLRRRLRLPARPPAR